MQRTEKGQEKEILLLHLFDFIDTHGEREIKKKDNQKRERKQCEYRLNCQFKHLLI